MKGPVQPLDGFVDIEVQKPRLRLRNSGAALLFSLFLIASLVPIWHFVDEEYQRFAVIVLLLLITIPLLIIVMIKRARHVRAIRGLASEANPEGCAHYVARQFRAGDVPGYAFELVKELIRAGQTNVTVRLGPVVRAIPIEPFAFPFSPLLLNESDSAFVQLEESTGSAKGNGPRADMVHGNETDEGIAIRTMIRNVHLTGGWIPMAFLGLIFMTTLVAFAALRQRDLLLPLGIFTLITIAVLFVSPVSGRSSSRQLLLLPGGLLLRKPARDPWKSQLHLFKRRESVLCVSRLGRPTWLLHVDDGDQKFIATITAKEAHMLLRAWLSPLEPPPVEKLIDLQ